METKDPVFGRPVPSKRELRDTFDLPGGHSLKLQVEIPGDLAVATIDALIGEFAKGMALALEEHRRLREEERERANPQQRLFTNPLSGIRHGAPAGGRP